MTDALYRRLYNDLKSFIPESRMATDPLRTLAYGTDASFYRLIPKLAITTRIDQLSEAESRHVLDLLFAHVQQPVFQVRYRWQAGTLAIWDNRATWHYAMNDYDGARRLLHRVTIEGVAGARFELGEQLSAVQPRVAHREVEAVRERLTEANRRSSEAWSRIEKRTVPLE